MDKFIGGDAMLGLLSFSSCSYSLIREIVYGVVDRVF